MPLTDLRDIPLHDALSYTSRFGLNRSQGAYFYQIVQNSPPHTHLADLTHASQPSATSLVARLLHEACGTPPRLSPQEAFGENKQSWYDLGIKRMEPLTLPSDQKVVGRAVPSPFDRPLPGQDFATILATIGDRASPPTARSSFATSPLQLSPLLIPTPLGSTDRCHSYGITTQSSFDDTLLTDDSNLPPQYLHHFYTTTATHPEPIQQDDMDCLPPSPFLSSDVDMDILTDTATPPPSYDPAPWTRWIPNWELAPLPPFQHDTSDAPRLATTWRTPAQEPPPFTNQYPYSSTSTPPPSSLHATLDGARNELPKYSPVFATPEPLPIDPPNDQTERTVETHQRPPPHFTLIASLLDEFERSLTLVADETPFPEGSNPREYDRPLTPTPPRVLEHELRTALEPTTGHPRRADVYLDRSDPGFDSVADANGNAHHDPPPPECEATEPLREGEETDVACFANERETRAPLETDHGARPPPRPRLEREPGGRVEDGNDQPSACFLDLANRLRQRLKSTPLPADAFFEAPVSRLPRPRPPTPPLSRRPPKPGPSKDGNTSGRTARLAPVGRHPAANEGSDRSRRGAEETQPDRAKTLKRTRFVVPDAEEEDGDGDGMDRRLARSRRTRGAGTASPRRTTATRSILRNARALTMPYQSAGMRRRGTESVDHLFS